MTRSRYIILSLAVLVAGLIAAFAFVPYTFSHLPAGAQRVPLFHALWVMWNQFPDFQHGMIVPLLSIGVIYYRRKDFQDLPIKGSLVGVILLALTMAAYWAGRRIDVQYVGFFAIQMFIVSFVLAFYGWGWLKALAFPLAFLVFAWPMPFLDNLVAFPLRVVMSNAAVNILNLFGLGAIQNGTAIVSAPNPALGFAAGDRFAVDVADPCSGIRSLFALMMVSALYAQFALKTPGKRIALFLSSIPLAVLGNLVRILLLTIGLLAMGPEIAIGTLEEPTLFHTASGFAVFLVALGGMILVANLLDRGWKANRDSVTNLARSVSVAQKQRAPQPSADIY